MVLQIFGLLAHSDGRAAYLHIPFLLHLLQFLQDAPEVSEAILSTDTLVVFLLSSRQDLQHLLLCGRLLLLSLHGLHIPTQPKESRVKKRGQIYFNLFNLTLTNYSIQIFSKLKVAQFPHYLRIRNVFAIIGIIRF